MLLPDPITPAIEAVLQIAPLASLSAATAACAQRNGPIKLVVSIRDQKSSVSASRSANGIWRGCGRRPGIVDEKVEPAERVDRIRHHALRLARLADIAGCGDGPVALHLEA